MALKDIILLLALTSTFLMSNNARAIRDLPLAARLEVTAGGLTDCWSALIEIKSCSNEIVLFFINGQADLGPECCSAIDVITKNCWPAMLTSLGFTAEEGNILRGYCDASGGGPVAAPPLSGGSLASSMMLV